MGSSADCMEGFNLLFFLIWVFLLFVTAWSAFFVSGCLMVTLCCAPCIYRSVVTYIREHREGRRERKSVIDAIVTRQYNPEDFKEHTDCAICMTEFAEDDQVTPLPCNTGHYFHSACI